MSRRGSRRTGKEEPLPQVPGYQLIRKIGQGGEGTIFEGTRAGSDGGKLVIKRRTCGDLTHANESLQEVLTMCCFRGVDQIVQIEDAFLQRFGLDSDAFYLNIVMEKCEGDMLGMLMNRGLNSEPLLASVIKSQVFDVLKGVEALHRARIIHRDVKLDNLFLPSLSDPSRVKVGDLGLGKRFAGIQAEEHRLDGTHSYMAPELFSSRKGIQGPEGDVWAVGVCLFELMSSTSPMYYTRKPINIGEQANSDSKFSVSRLIASIDCPDYGGLDREKEIFQELRALLRSLLEPDPVRRATAASALASPLFVNNSDSMNVMGNQQQLCDRVIVRPFSEVEKQQAASVLAVSFLKDPRTYLQSVDMTDEDRMDTTLTLYTALVTQWVLKRPTGCWGAFVRGVMIGAMLLLPPDSPTRFLTEADLNQKRFAVLRSGRSRSAMMSKCARSMLIATARHCAETMDVCWLGVLPAYRRLGVGQQLLRVATEWADSKQAAVRATCFHSSQCRYLTEAGQLQVTTTVEPRLQQQQQQQQGGGSSSSSSGNNSDLPTTYYMMERAPIGVRIVHSERSLATLLRLTSFNSFDDELGEQSIVFTPRTAERIDAIKSPRNKLTGPPAFLLEDQPVGASQSFNIGASKEKGSEASRMWKSNPNPIDDQWAQEHLI